VDGRQPRSAATCRGAGWSSNRQSRAVGYVSVSVCHKIFVASAAYLDDRHNIVGRVLELAHVDIEVTQLVLLRLLEHQVAPLAHGIDALEIAGGVEVWVGSARQRDVRDARGGCGVLVGHCGVFGVAVEREGRVAVVGRVFVAGSAVVAVVPAGEEAHDIYDVLLYAAVTLSGRAGSSSSLLAVRGAVDFARPSGRRL